MSAQSQCSSQLVLLKDWPEHLMSQSRVILTKCATSRSIIKEILIVRHVMDINIKLLDRAVSRIYLVIFDKNPVISGEILYNTPQVWFSI